MVNVSVKNKNAGQCHLCFYNDQHNASPCMHVPKKTLDVPTGNLIYFTICMSTLPKGGPLLNQFCPIIPVRSDLDGIILPTIYRMQHAYVMTYSGFLATSVILHGNAINQP